MRHSILVALAATLAVGAAYAVQQKLHLAEGSKAPAFSGKTHDGTTVSLAELTKDGPAFVVFWKERCPHNPRAAALFNSIYKAYEGKAKMVGIVTAPQERLKDWVNQFSVAYPLLADADKKIIHDYAVVYSICTFQIGKDGTIEKVFPGYGSEAMSALNAAMAKAAGTEAKNVDLSAAPPRLTWG